MRHYAMTRSLRIINKQKKNQAKCEDATSDPVTNNAIRKVNNSTKRKFSDNHNSKKVTKTDNKNASIISMRERLKTEAQVEDRIAIKTPRTRLK